MPVPSERQSERSEARGSRRSQATNGADIMTIRTNNHEEPQARNNQPKLDTNNQNVLFNQSKEEMFSLTQGYKKFQRELKNWKIATNREDITLERLASSRVFITVAPQKKFTSSELDAMKRYLTQMNGSLLLLLTEGGESKLNTNLNVLLDEFGINVNNDSIIRTSYFKYFNPKEALVPDGILNRYATILINFIVQ